jgi:hypothetical protein
VRGFGAEGPGHGSGPARRRDQVGPAAQDRSGVARVDHVFDLEHLGRTERAAIEVEPVADRLDLGGERLALELGQLGSVRDFETAFDRQ